MAASRSLLLSGRGTLGSATRFLGARSVSTTSICRLAPRTQRRRLVSAASLVGSSLALRKRRTTSTAASAAMAKKAAATAARTANGILPPRRTTAAATLLARRFMSSSEPTSTVLPKVHRATYSEAMPMSPTDEKHPKGHVPADRLYRRPHVPAPSTQLGRDDLDLMWFCPQAPEPYLDQLDDNDIVSTRAALLMLGIAAGVLYGGFNLIVYLREGVDEHETVPAAEAEFQRNSPWDYVLLERLLRADFSSRFQHGKVTRGEREAIMEGIVSELGISPQVALTPDVIDKAIAMKKERYRALIESKN